MSANLLLLYSRRKKTTHIGLTCPTRHGLWHACKVHAWTYKQTRTHSCVACWQVVHAQGNTSLPSTNSTSRLSTSAESNWSTYVGARTIQTAPHPSQGSKGTHSVCSSKTPISSLFDRWANDTEWSGHERRWTQHLMICGVNKIRQKSMSELEARRGWMVKRHGDVGMTTRLQGQCKHAVKVYWLPGSSF